MLHAPDLELLLDLGADRGSLPVVEPQHAGEERARLALEPRVPVGELEPRGGERLDVRALERAHRAFERARADVLPVAARVPVDRAADRAGDPGGVGEAGEPAVAAELDEREIVGAAAHVRRGALELHVVDGVLHHEPAEAFVRDQQVAAAAEQEARECELGRGRQRVDELILRAGREEPVGGPADANRGVVAQRFVLAQAVPDGRAQSVSETGGAKSHGTQIALRRVRGSNCGRIPTRAVHIESTCRTQCTPRAARPGASAPLPLRGKRMKIEIRYCGQ
jgi:hypothetical protein